MRIPKKPARKCINCGNAIKNKFAGKFCCRHCANTYKYKKHPPHVQEKKKTTSKVPNILLVNPKTGKVDKRLHPREDKLSDADVVAIRRAYRRGDISLRKLAKQYGVSHVYISYLVKRKKRITV